MASRHKEVRSIPSGPERSELRATEGPNDLATDVRSMVETQFRQMDQTHDRIRAEELTARLSEHTIG